MANFNEVFLMGRLTRAPELRFTPNQTPVTSFGLAVNRRWKDSAGAEHEAVMFIECKSVGSRARAIEKFLAKGSLVFITGFLQFEKWESPAGAKRSRHVVMIRDIQFLSFAGGTDGDSGHNEDSEDEQTDAL